MEAQSSVIRDSVSAFSRDRIQAWENKARTQVKNNNNPSIMRSSDGRWFRAVKKTRNLSQGVNGLRPFSHSGSKRNNQTNQEVGAENLEDSMVMDKYKKDSDR